MSFNADLTRKGPGLLVRDITRSEDQVSAVIAQIVRLKPDILALQSVDYDYDGIAAKLLKAALKDAGHAMPHHFLTAPNTGVPTGFDIDRNDRFGEARDMQGYGKFTGQGGLLLLSRFPVLDEQSRDFTDTLWQNVPFPRLPELNGASYFKDEELAILRLHNVAAWDVAISTPDGVLRVLMSQAGPPVFDGPEDRNGQRNADEITFWDRYIDMLGVEPFAIMAGLNNDPVDGEGDKPALRQLLANPKLSDPNPQSQSGSTDTVDWKFDDMRVDYVLPSAGFIVQGSGVDWPAAEPQGGFASRHRPVWVDVLWQ
jgi:endonuclease/exonuclease/phosphatase family metal-dependent hydrolase